MSKIYKRSTSVFISLAIMLVIGIVVVSTRSWSTDNKVSSQTGTLETYTDETYHFSLKYPADLKVSSFRNPDDSGDIVLIAGQTAGTGMQVSITPFDEDTNVLTVERIKADVPNLTIIAPQDVTLGTTGRGVAFFDGSGADAHRQVWFVANKYLYQITAPVSFDGGMKEILNSWTFF